MVITSPLGRGGGAFDNSRLTVIKSVKEAMESQRLALPIHVDGGIYPATAAACATHGATHFCCGSWLAYGSYGPGKTVHSGTIAQRVSMIRFAVSDVLGVYRLVFRDCEGNFAGTATFHLGDNGSAEVLANNLMGNISAQRGFLEWRGGEKSIYSAGTPGAGDDLTTALGKACDSIRVQKQSEFAAADGGDGFNPL